MSNYYLRRKSYRARRCLFRLFSARNISPYILIECEYHTLYDSYLPVEIPMQQEDDSYTDKHEELWQQEVMPEYRKEGLINTH